MWVRLVFFFSCPHESSCICPRCQPISPYLLEVFGLTSSLYPNNSVAFVKKDPFPVFLLVLFSDFPLEHSPQPASPPITENGFCNPHFHTVTPPNYPVYSLEFFFFSRLLVKAAAVLFPFLHYLFSFSMFPPAITLLYPSSPSGFLLPLCGVSFLPGLQTPLEDREIFFARSAPFFPSSLNRPVFQSIKKHVPHA